MLDVVPMMQQPVRVVCVCVCVCVCVRCCQAEEQLQSWLQLQLRPQRRKIRVRRECEDEIGRSCVHMKGSSRGGRRGDRRSGRGGSGNGDPSAGTPCTVLTLHQPLASMLAYGLQRLDGRTWSTTFRGTLWIHAAAKEPEPEAIAYWQEVYREVFSMDGEGEPSFPPCYPTSALVGCVEMVDCVAASEFETWKDTLPQGAYAEARAHGDDFYFLVHAHKRLMLPLQMPGQHKLWQLEHGLAKSLLNGGLVDSEVMPINWIGHKEASLAASAARGSDGIDGDKRGKTSSRRTSKAPTVGGDSQQRPGASKEEDDAFDTWMLAQALELTVTERLVAEAQRSEEAAAATGLGMQEEEELVLCTMQPAAVADDWPRMIAADEATQALSREAYPGYDPVDVAISPPQANADWERKVSELTAMGFERARAAEMLELTGADVEAAVALLCS